MATNASLSFAAIAATLGPILLESQNSQVAPVPLSFEVASVRPSGPNTDRNRSEGDCHGVDSGGNYFGADPGMGRCVFRGVTLKALISMAYSPVSFGGRLGFPLDRIEHGASELRWVNTERFDIQAKAESTDKATEAQLFQMLQQLLADRFKLRLHRETREVSGYLLQVAKGGLRLKRPTGNESRPGMIVPGAPPSGGFFGGQALPVESIASLVQGRLGRPVRDETGLTGLYNWELRWAPDDNEIRPDGLPVLPRAADDFRPSFTTALQEQLGLRLESGQVAIEILVIDQAETPIPN
jgi:uncharacterized protein (TIGR03435 family)